MLAYQLPPPQNAAALLHRVADSGAWIDPPGRPNRATAPQTVVLAPAVAVTSTPAPAVDARAERVDALVKLVEFEGQGFVVMSREQFATDDKIDLIIGHRRYSRLWSRYVRAVRADAVSRDTADFSSRFAALNLPPEAVAVMVEAAPILTELVSVTTGRADPLVQAIKTRTTLEERDENPLWFTDEQGIPAVVARGLLASHRSLVALHVLDFGRSLNDYGVSDDDLLSLAHLFRDSIRKYFGLVVSALELEAPLAVTSPVDRIDIEAANARHRAVLAAVDQIRRSGVP